MKIALAIAAVLLLIQQGGCAPMPPNEPQCTDVTTMQETISDVDFESAQIAGEVNDDVHEMGQENNCTGYQKGPQKDD